MKRVLFASVVVAALSLGTFAACKQGQGERCQIDEDCAGGLVCNKAKNTCQSTTGGDLDAGLIDAVPEDAPVDTP